MSERVRKVDFYPADWLAGIAGLGLGHEAVGVFWNLCALCYDSGSATICQEVAVKRLAGISGDSQRRVRATIQRLILAGKVSVREPFDEVSRPQIEPNRVRVELERSTNRLRVAREAGTKGGRPRKQNNDLAKPNGYFSEKLSNIKHQTSNITHHTGFSESDREQTRIEDRLMELTGLRDEAKIADAVRLLLITGCSGELIIEAAKIAGPKLRGVANPGAYLKPIIAQLVAKLPPSDAKPTPRIPPEVLKAYTDACQAAETKGLKLGDKGYPSLRDFGWAA